MLAARQLAGRADVGHAHRLTAAGVVGHGDHDQRDLLAFAACTRSRERARSILPLKGWSGRLAALGDHQVHRLPPRYSTLARVVSKWLLLGTTSPGCSSAPKRMRSAARPWWVGMTCLKPVILRTTRLEAVKGAGAGIRFIALHHAGPLAGGHGAGAAVGQQVDQHVVGFELRRGCNPALASALRRCAGDVWRIGSTVLMRNGSMMVLNFMGGLQGRRRTGEANRLLKRALRQDVRRRQAACASVAPSIISHPQDSNAVFSGGAPAARAAGVCFGVWVGLLPHPHPQTGLCDPMRVTTMRRN